MNLTFIDYVYNKKFSIKKLLTAIKYASSPMLLFYKFRFPMKIEFNNRLNQTPFQMT